MQSSNCGWPALLLCGAMHQTLTGYSIDMSSHHTVLSLLITPKKTTIATPPLTCSGLVTAESSGPQMAWTPLSDYIEVMNKYPFHTQATRRREEDTPYGYQYVYHPGCTLTNHIQFNKGSKESSTVTHTQKIILILVGFFSEVSDCQKGKTLSAQYCTGR